MMRLFILVIILSCSCFEKQSSKQKYIKIEHIGERDKPIATVIISTKDLQEEEWKKVIIVNEQTFNKIYGFISEIKDDLNLRDGKVNFQAWEIFRITAHSDQATLTFVTSKKTESSMCFTQLVNALQAIEDEEGIKSTIHELQILLKRIG